MNIMEYIEEANSLARRAIDFDQSGCIDAAAYYYREAARLLNHVVEISSLQDSEKLIEKAREYKERADLIQVSKSVKREEQHPDVSRLKRCKFLFVQALDADEAGQKDTAIKLYTEAVEMTLKAKSETENKEFQTKLAKILLNALERAEELKGIKSTPPLLESVVSSTESLPSRASTMNQASGQRPPLHRGSSAHLKVSGGTTYSQEEKIVLLATSMINTHEFVPFMSIDLNERFQYAVPFTDRDGPLKLSPKQSRHFVKWARPEEFCSEPRLIQGAHVDYFSIKQTIVSDCSFVASLAVSAQYEKKFGRRLITSIIYPQNRNREPIFNPFGKYMVKLHLNGVPRKVIIDDTLPIGKHGELLCSFSTNKNEMWISFLEKAYMKVMGGYDFPGSNSNIDLHALTGWIPERAAIRVQDTDFNADSLFETLFTRLHHGDVLITVATGEMSDHEAERAGLVPTHAYAVLDVRKVNGIKLLQLKNPWSHVRWRGNYSELDLKHWTPDICKALNYDPSNAAMFDNGIFWIDYNSILNFFDVFYLNWNPEMFKFTYCIHQSWSAGIGPVKDSYNIGDNPQFRLSCEGSGSIWILLTRHITEIEDFKQNTEYITVLVYKNDGKRVYYPYDPPPYLDGIRINSPHYLTKIILKDSAEKNFTLVVSQYEKMHTIYYSLRAYATCPFTLEKIPNPYMHIKKITDGEWKGISAGGCKNHPQTYSYNPCFKFTLHSRSSVVIDLKAPKQFQIGFEVSPAESSSFTPRSTGAYRSGFVVLELDDVPEGVYHIVPSTFLPNQESPFFLTIKSSNPIQVSQIR